MHIIIFFYFNPSFLFNAWNVIQSEQQYSDTIILSCKIQRDAHQDIQADDRKNGCPVEKKKAKTKPYNGSPVCYLCYLCCVTASDLVAPSWTTEERSAVYLELRSGQRRESNLKETRVSLQRSARCRSVASHPADSGASRANNDSKDVK